MNGEDLTHARQALHAYINEGDTERGFAELSAMSEAGQKCLLNLFEAVAAERRKEIKA